jgi:hypothetical protein
MTAKRYKKSLLHSLLIKPRFKKHIVFLSVLFFIKCFSYGQCVHPITSNCNPATSTITSQNDNITFLFDSFSKYNAGIYLYGHTIVKLKVDSIAPHTCNWKLAMMLSNKGWINPDQWNTLTTYGSGSGGGVNPPLDLLEIRVTNPCSTAMPGVDGVWKKFPVPSNPCDMIYIINDPLNNTAAGTCSAGNQTNGAGTYLGANYGEYTFTIDYRIRPHFNYIPGTYNLELQFWLSE